MEGQTPVSNLSRISRKDFSGFYLLVALAGVVLASLANFLRPMSPVFKGQGLEILIPFLFLSLALIIWIRYVPNFDWDRKTKIFLLLVIGYWVCSFSLDSIQGDAVNYTTFILPIVIGMVYLKPLDTRTMFATVDGFALLIIIISIVGQIAVGSGWVTPRTEFPHRLFLLTEFGFDWRWEGVFGNVNYSGPVGAFLLVYGLGRGKWLGWIFAVSGLVFLLASESRGALAAAFIGCVIVLISKSSWGNFRISVPVRLSIGSLLILIPLLGSAISDPTGNGRVTVWRDFISVWPQAPVFGVSEKQISVYLRQGDLSFFSTHGHNIFVQSIVTQGIIGIVLLIALFGIGLFIAIQGVRKHLVVGLAVFVTMLVCNIDEDLFSGNYLSIQYLPIILVVLLTSTQHSISVLPRSLESGADGN